MTLPGVTAVDVAIDLRPKRDPRIGDRVSAAGPLQKGSTGSRRSTRSSSTSDGERRLRQLGVAIVHHQPRDVASGASPENVVEPATDASCRRTTGSRCRGRCRRASRCRSSRADSPARCATPRGRGGRAGGRARAGGVPAHDPEVAAREHAVAAGDEDRVVATGFQAAGAERRGAVEARLLRREDHQRAPRPPAVAHDPHRVDALAPGSRIADADRIAALDPPMEHGRERPRWRGREADGRDHRAVVGRYGLIGTVTSRVPGGPTIPLSSTSTPGLAWTRSSGRPPRPWRFAGTDIRRST